MRSIKNTLAAFLMVAVLSVGTAFATDGDGIIVAGLKADTCTVSDDTKVDWGIIVAGATGIIVAGLTGIIVAGAAETPAECGIIVAG
jgi:hypothetical protein